MKNENICLMNSINFFRSKKYRIGFVTDDYPSSYNAAIASTRIRVYDVILWFFRDKEYLLEIYNPVHKYNMVIFRKKFDGMAHRLASNLKGRGVKIILDIDVNYYNLDSKYTTEKQFQDIMKFTGMCDAIITSSNYLNNCIIKKFPKLRRKIFLIPPHINSAFFIQQKIHKKKSVCKLLYCGYGVKAKQILLIRDILLNIKRRHNIELVFICEKNPLLRINKIPTKYIKYNHQKIYKQLLVGDIFIAPRNVSDPYNLGHSFIKIGYPMAIGIPVVASPVPSYISSPAILCETGKQWEENLIKLIRNTNFRNELGERGVEYCKNFYSEEIIKKKYREFFIEIL